MALTKRSTKGSPLTIEEMDANWDYVTPGEYVEVTIASGSTSYSDGRPSLVNGILTCGSTPIEVLPTPGANAYYEYYGICEYTYNTTAYTLTNDLPGILRENSYSGGLMRPDLLTSGGNRFVEFRGNGPVDPTTASAVDYYPSFWGLLNEAVVFTILNGTDPTLGDGTVLVKIWYKVRTFGTEL